MKKTLVVTEIVLFALVMTVTVEAAAPSARNGVVITTNPEWVEECEYAGEVRAGSSWGGLTMKKVAEKKTYKKLSKRAAEAGMDIVLVHDSKVGFGGSRAQATGYVCEPIAECTTSASFTRHEYPTESPQGVEGVPSGWTLRVYAHGPPGWVITNAGWTKTAELLGACDGLNIPAEEKAQAGSEVEAELRDAVGELGLEEDDQVH